MTKLGTLERIANPKEIWPHEARDFSVWLAQEENLSLLSETLGLGAGVFEVEELEANVGSYRADIVCRMGVAGDVVVIENQFGATDHDHLGKLLTYAAGRRARVLIWIAERVRDEHRAAMDWLNELSGENTAIFVAEIELWRIGDSAPAPRFNVVVRPNDFERLVVKPPPTVSPTGALQRRYWAALSDHLKDAKAGFTLGKPQPANWMSIAVGRTGCSINPAIVLSAGVLRVDLYLGGPQAKERFDWLHARREQIESAFGETLDWQRLDEKKDALASIARSGVDIQNEAEWSAQHAWFADTISRLRVATMPVLREMPREFEAVE